MTIPRILLAMWLAWWSSSPMRAADRASELAKLLADYKSAEAEFWDRELPDKPSPRDRIQKYKSHPRRIYVPKILALAEAEPNDPTALAASKWIVDRVVS